MKLVLVESPTKAKAISKYLGDGYRVIATKGHIAELRKRPFGVDIDTGFEPHYELTEPAAERLREIESAAAQSDAVYFATDPDREGEAISWHLCRALHIAPETARRVEFREITRDAVLSAMQKPHAIDLQLVNAYQARAILDYVIGFTLSPLLSAKVCRRLSGGRVQSAVLHQICQRDASIAGFVPQEYWTVEAQLEKGGVSFAVKAVPEAFDGASAQALASQLQHAAFTVTEAKHTERQEKPQPPFTTSKLQQDAANRLGFDVDRTMRVAQQLFEGVALPGGDTGGLITYMRTDSVRVSDEAAQAARDRIGADYGAAYLPEQAVRYATAADAQDAHEAIRPVDMALKPELLVACLTAEQRKLYQLIYSRFIASQMSPARRETVSVRLAACGRLFQCGSSKLLFDGYRKAYAGAEDDAPEEGAVLPSLRKNDVCTCRSADCAQHFSKPPAHYTQASMVKQMEESGIGRPSTYASTIKKVLERGYAELDGRSLRARPLGVLVDGLLSDSFDDLTDPQYTRDMEARLDQVAAGDITWTGLLKDAWAAYAPQLASARANMPKAVPQQTDKICPICHAPMLKRLSRSGAFLGCSNYPVCNHTEPLPETGDRRCAACGTLMEKHHKQNGRVFYTCANTACEKYREPPADAEAEAAPPPQILSWARNVSVTKAPLSAMKLARHITAAAPDGQSINGAGLSAKLAALGLLAEQADAFGNKRMLPTEQGKQRGIGIRQSHADPQRPMEIAVFDTDAQRYVLQQLTSLGFSE